MGGVKTLKKLNLTGRSMDSANLRARKVAKPECHVPVEIWGKTEYTTGPCQQAAAHDTALRYTWYLTCTHGPVQDAEGNPIPEHLRSYYEEGQVIEKKPITNSEGVIERWEERTRNTTQLRIGQVVLSDHTGGRESVQEMIRKGIKDVSEFGIAPFCEYYNCYRQDVRQFSNGTFCSPYHAKMVKARETGVILALGGWDSGGPRRGTAGRSLPKRGADRR